MKKEIAIVLGSKGVNATGLIRSLGMAGLSVTFASMYSKIESRYAENYLRLPEDMKLWVDILKIHCKALDKKPVVYPVDDITAYFIDDNYMTLSEFATIPHAQGRMRELADKTVMAELAREVGLYVAPFKKCTIQKLEARPVGLPLIIKPLAAFAGGKGDIRICRTEEDYNDAIKLLKRKTYEQVMVQKLIEHEEQYEIGLMGCSFPDGRVILPATIKKVRSYPAGRGSTSYAQVVNGFCGLDIEKVKSLVRKTGYIGVFDIEMIVSDGMTYFIEINYRNGQYGFALTKAGYNIPVNWFRGMNGETVGEPGTISEIFYMNERDDFLHVKHGEVSRKQWIREFRNAAAFGMYCPGDQRPFIRQYVKIPDRVIIKANALKRRVTDFFVREEWIIAIRPRKDKLLFEEGGTAEPFLIVPNSFRMWCADPFIITVGEKDYLFFEMFDRFKGRGVIGCRTIQQNGTIGKMKQVYETTKHLSFPFVFESDGEIYMMPESSYDQNLTLLKARCFPDEWEKVKMWFEGEKICDTVIFEKDGETYLLTQPVEEPYTHAKLDLYEKKGEQWDPCILNPVVNDASKARMAGAVVNRDGKLIRPAQDCKGYGDAIIFNNIVIGGEEVYTERVVTRITPLDIILENSNEKYHGIHTYNKSAHFEVVDLKEKSRIHLGYLGSILYRLKKK